MKNINKNIILSFFATALIFFTSSNTIASANDVIVPRSTEIPAIATMELSSQNLFQGQNVSVTVNNNFYYNNNLVIPLGSSINGTVTTVQKADKAGNEGKLGVAFTNITTPYGTVIPISGMLKTEDNTGIIKGNVTKDNIDEIVKGSVKGAAAGNYISKNNSITTGSAMGSAIAASAYAKGHPAVISVGTIVNIILNQQSTFKAVEGYQY